MAGSKGIHGFLRNSFLTTCNIESKIRKGAKFSFVAEYQAVGSEISLRYNPSNNNWKDKKSTTLYKFEAKFEKISVQPADIIVELDCQNKIDLPSDFKNLEF